MVNIRILICDPIHEEGIKILEDAGFIIDKKTSITSKKLLEIIDDYDAIIVRSRTKVTENIIKKASKLKAIARAGVGLDNIDLETAKKRGIEVFNSPEAPCNAVAELVIGLILNLARNITLGDSSLKQGKWMKSNLTGIEISGKTLGIIGFGRIGYLVGKKAQALGMNVLAYDVMMDKVKPYIDEVGATATSFETVLEKSDFISVHVPLLPQTKNLIDKEEFNLMKQGAYIINAARGGIVNEAALKIALNSKIAGAALDVFSSEPDPDPDLINRLNVVCTPHIGAGSIEAQKNNSLIVAKKLREFFYK